MPQPKIFGVITAFQEKHILVYTFLCQLVIAVVTFYCAIVISHYDPTSLSIPDAAALQSLLSDANSMETSCKSSAQKSFHGFDAVLVAITTYSLLCPSTALFLLSLFLFLFGISTFNFLHTEDVDLVDGYSYFIIAGLISVDWSLDWQDILKSLQVTMPILIWSSTLLLPIGHWLCKTFLPGPYWRYRRWTRSHREVVWKMMDCRGGTVDNVDSERGAVEGRVNEETRLMTDEGRTQMYGHT